jgi:hypothetical protein
VHEHQQVTNTPNATIAVANSLLGTMAHHELVSKALPDVPTESPGLS